MAEPVRDVPIRDDSIRLGQFMKLADLIDRGSDAKAELAADAVTVNGTVETRRGRQLHPGDTVTVATRSARVVHATEVG
jgi:ribosome-associated protein